MSNSGKHLAGAAFSGLTAAAIMDTTSLGAIGTFLFIMSGFLFLRWTYLAMCDD